MSKNTTNLMRMYTHPEVLGKGVEQGWADPITDPAEIDWAPVQAAAAIWFEVVDGRPVNPCAPTGIERGRGELGHWGERQAADAIVTATTKAGRWVLMVERDDDHGWAIPGGCLDPGEDALTAAIRELAEETGLILDGVSWQVLPVRYVPDPRATDEAWMVTWPAVADLGDVAELPAVAGADDARRAEWVRADTYAALVTHLADTYEGRVFAAHQAMLAELLAVPARTERRTAAGRLRCEHAFPVQPPYALWAPGPCTGCGTRWEERQPVPEQLVEPLAALLDAAARLDALLALVPAGQWSLHEDLIVTGGTAQSAILTDARDDMDALVLSGDWHGEALAAIRLLTALHNEIRPLTAVLKHAAHEMRTS
ncbi:NUDIX domain-containing protein [Streptosporangium minutum]|uniref:NUDIX domain-containing protein n=1 Tax=Streptosporangium minutum TaxID=569862 RepID=UPI000A3CC1BE|nr:NUDIX domain-containing protein [Streptosporangium minutum]